MMCVIQRVSQAHVDVGGQTLGRIAQGYVALLCVERDDSALEVDRLLDKLLKLRIFSDDAGKMNRSLLNIDGQEKIGDLLVISQFTLAADVWSGNRPSFTRAAPAGHGRELYELFVQKAKQHIPHVATGEFGADMQVHLVNDGPVTIPIHISGNIPVNI